MKEINLNSQLAHLLEHHGVNVATDGDFITTDLPGNEKFKANCVYQEINNGINSRLDVTVLTGKGEEILESFGDLGATVEDAVRNNFWNFSAGSLHPLLAALGSSDLHAHDQVTIEEWKINGKIWEAYIGNLIPKVYANQNSMTPPPEFFDLFVNGIQAQQLSKHLHWFRGYYFQLDNEIAGREFLMDNTELTEAGMIFNAIPVIPGIKFYSCRNFIVLKNKTIIDGVLPHR